jgi:uncharacterized protein
MTTTINWFEIPVANMDRAAKFYGALLGSELKRGDFVDVPHAFFSNGKDMIGALVHDPHNKPVSEGRVLYFGSQDIEGALARVRELGAEVIVPKTDIGDPGHIAVLRDSEGNRVGLHTPR